MPLLTFPLSGFPHLKIDWNICRLFARFSICHQKGVPEGRHTFQADLNADRHPWSREARGIRDHVSLAALMIA